jgi:hypothetical protein
MASTPFVAPPEPVWLMLDGLQGVRRSGTGWMARCPAHLDRVASLSVAAGDDGRALVYCHAGCNTDAILAAAGLAPADLFEPRPTSTKQVRATRRQKPSARPTLYVIRNRTGEPVAIHERIDTPPGKRMSWRLPDG